MADIHDVADYLIVKLAEAGSLPSVHRLNKLFYYAQGWNLAVHGRAMFDAKFQAWVHGPTNRTVFDRLTGRDRCLYSIVDIEQVRTGFRFDGLLEEDRRMLDEILEAYGMYSGTDLQEMSRSEPAWREARRGLEPASPSTNELDEGVMAAFFRSQMAEAA